MPRTWLLRLILIIPIFTACDQSATAPNNPPDDATPPAVPAAPDSVTLDFESIATSAPIAQVGPGYSEAGYMIDATGDGSFSTWGSTSPNFAGSTGLFLNTNLDLDIALRRADGKQFSALAVDLAPMARNLPGAVVEFIGTRADGSRVTQTHVTGTDMRFTTYRLEGFTSLVELRWKQRATGNRFHQFDKIVLEVVR